MVSQSLSAYWVQAGELLGFTVEAPYVVALPDGGSITFAARLPEFGASKGMLLSSCFGDFSFCVKALSESGFGHFVLSEPKNLPQASVIVDVLKDWGWSASSPPPSWL